MTSLIDALAALRVGVEPDIRFGSTKISDTEKVVLFRLDNGAPEAPSAAYEFASLAVHMAAAVAGSGGEVSPEEESRLEEHVALAFHLHNAERTRLDAHLRWLLCAHPGLSGLKRRIAATDKEKRNKIGNFLIVIAAADGYVAPDELKTISKIFRLLELDSSDIYARVHSVMTALPAREPVTVREADNTRSGFAIPHPPDIAGTDDTATRTKGAEAPPDTAETDSAPGVALNYDLIEARLKETAAVTSLLSDIFSDEESADADRAEESHGERVFGDRVFGDRVFGDRVFGDRVFGDRVFGDGVFGDRVFRDRVFGDRVFGDRVFGGKHLEEKRENMDLNASAPPQADIKKRADPPIPKASDSGDTSGGLPLASSNFMQQLCAKSSWSRAELEALAEACDLMLDGTLEEINDVAFDTVGEPLWEGEDPVEINSDVWKELQE